MSSLGMTVAPPTTTASDFFDVSTSTARMRIIQLPSCWAKAEVAAQTAAVVRARTKSFFMLDTPVGKKKGCRMIPMTDLWLFDLDQKAIGDNGNKGRRRKTGIGLASLGKPLSRRNTAARRRPYHDTQAADGSEGQGILHAEHVYVVRIIPLDQAESCRIAAVVVDRSVLDEDVRVTPVEVRILRQGVLGSDRNPCPIAQHFPSVIELLVGADNQDVG